MAKVRANQRGYIGGVIREAGEIFDIPDAVMADKKLRPSWVSLMGSVALAEDPAPAAHAGDDHGGGDAGALEAMTVKDLRAYAKAHGIGLAAGVNTKAEIIDAIKAGPVSQMPTAEPFADAPEPVRVQNEINEALGATQPDWVTPGAEI